MSELDEQKSKIDWYKDLFKIYIAALFAIVAGLLTMITNGNTNLLFYTGLVVVVVLVVVAIFAADTVSKEIRKLREM